MNQLIDVHAISPITDGSKPNIRDGARYVVMCHGLHDAGLYTDLTNH